ncbi:MAG: hypothetical protein AAGJ68_10445 [Pseudomonadota bacterium]
MDRPADIIAEKSVSALLDNAKMARISKMILGLDGQISAKLSKKMIGGQWISGTAYLTQSGFEFHPGMLNRPFFKNMDELCLRLAWSDLTVLEKRFGMVASIIDLKTESETHSIRCNSADEFIQRMETLRSG